MNAQNDGVQRRHWLDKVLLCKIADGAQVEHIAEARMHVSRERRDEALRDGERERAMRSIWEVDSALHPSDEVVAMPR
ncbi:hypothetical protein EGR_01234 [Echinococcus granulosus]|uniref:Uncharacterized protein n=1 Tax=Echinococcus granulosus TaxID=6210 RepID=W6UTW9_ECHGR|nr:hypothetical protein EGR_01234 [Echinococcus granulosus]EUB64106.1 hypothetical protein EGR_01234 [Echinococcus granulosus]